MISDDKTMKVKTLIKRLRLISLLFAVSLLLITCKKSDPLKVDFVKCKINGVDYQSVLIIVDTITDNSILYKKITTTGNASQTEIIILVFKSALSVGTYQASIISGIDFFGIYIKNLEIEYYSTSGSLTLTNVSDRYEGSFNFMAEDDPTHSGDTVLVTAGSFSIKK